MTAERTKRGLPWSTGAGDRPRATGCWPRATGHWPLMLLVWAVWSMGGVEVAAELSKAAQARQYQRQAIKALKAKDPQKAIRALKELEPVTNERPWEWLYVYGTLLVEYGATPAERKTGHDLLHEVAGKIETMGKEEDPSYQPYYDAALDRLYEWKEKEEAAFARADSAGTAAAYAEYLAAYPQGRHAAAAEEKQNKRAAEEKKRAEEARRAEEEAAFARADSAETAAAYAEYLAAYPQGRHAEEAKVKEFRLRLPETLRKQMVHVRGGTFRMGCTAEQRDCEDIEKPVHQVQVSDFEIGKYEVTQEVWEAVMGENPSRFKGCSQCPVERVSWNGVQAFLTKLNEVTGARYRLPTEAEWEYAARGGQRSEGYQYAGSHGPDAVGWHEENSGGATHPVGQKHPNELGLYDMSGNVWEWTQDCWNANYRGAPDDGSAWQRGKCSSRVVRGGSWNFEPRALRSALRGRGDPAGYRYNSYGFRLARTLTP